MTGDDRQVVDHHEVHPALGVLVFVQRLCDNIEVDRIHKIDGHGHHVRYGERCQDTVGGRHHVSPRQDDDVDDVGHHSEQTDGGTDVTVVTHVVAVELEKAGDLGGGGRRGDTGGD